MRYGRCAALRFTQPHRVDPDTNPISKIKTVLRSKNIVVNLGEAKMSLSQHFHGATVRTTVVLALFVKAVQGGQNKRLHLLCC
jgi:hypothetical protein